ncbi:cytochrome o ubiquinol oxidase subunit III [Halopseudomonas aestusnigri]|jgi:cytochrome o ubiquinol oxidase subunit III|uniref:cytochrome o ubiquinol oxidase subunit III n=1 Tax=Halopseudomonas TaxID=2901189 RepID=UPI001D19438B|nr:MULTISPECIES: cytochrome o ubiquinol oxidase subunit III [Halopseudomonas]MCC4259116.1 cytochrome o ubiquinol oxidase subunit III [Halopseudomonas aestusnigri]MCK5531644.1 cytochrome o ubiquinol oxidase subunit III [Halopseudomonas aestusnigri]UGV32324.1 cytochrome o ubiquinol oxidase subunit III [Halopseudomonas aestusnigri]BDX19950.1 cytochrome bo(3) ubiquinol oxidase subunit 3 [Halopseudomonas aestusnigri]GMQ54128.1 cytochrome o ubiquinol oxidase subunit III [Halopseudomonas aestusnigri]
MSSTVMHSNHAVAHDDHAHHDTGGNTVFGFWLYLMTDCILFACVFATYAVLVNHTAGGPSGKDIFELPYVLGETALLLVSSCTYGFAMIAAHRGFKGQTLAWLAATFVLGAGFIGMELNEFHHLIAEGFGPDKSAFLSSFFTLVGMHGLHVTAGLVWMIVMMLQVSRRGLTDRNNTRLMCLSLFWHFLDIVWICVFTIVYLMGTI